MVQAFLNDAEKQQVTKEAVKLWLRNLEAVAFDANNVLDELNYEVLRQKVEKANKLKKKVQALFSFSTRTMALKIMEINENLNKINQEATNYGLQSQLNAHATSFLSDSLAERETDSYSVDSVVVGRENYVSSIVEILTSSNPNNDEQEVFSILPIVGMGGLGKTTSAKLVFHNEKIKAHFGKLIWVYVSEIFDTKDVFKKILESLTKQRVDLETKDALLRNIQEHLEVKKYLLVLDDVWTEEPRKWGEFLDTLSSISSIKGNGIIVTTRSEHVASIVGTIRIPDLSRLQDEDCWSIIKEKAFGKRCAVPTEFETTGKKIAKRCQGLPLAAKVVGGLLCRKSKEEWHAIEETNLSNLGEAGNSISKILKLSFDNLPSQSLKKCFAFCSIFPKGFYIEKGMLVNLWMSEGFLQNDHENDMEIIGNKYFNHLLQNSLLQVVEHDNSWDILYCNMHDLVHDLACSILRETGPVRYIYTKSITHISKEDARNLRSLIFEGKVSDDMMFSNFKCLRSLVLIGYENKELPKVEHLIHLRYLDTLATGVKCLPNAIGNLYHLQSLRANNALKELPESSKKLRNLRHFCILKPLLSHIGVYKGIRNEEIPMLLHMQNLRSLYLDLPNVRSIGSSLDKIQDTTILFPHLECLRLIHCRKLTSFPSHLPCLKHLFITGMDTSLLLDNLLINLTSLTKLKIDEIKGLICLPDMFFHDNQNLSYLSISHCPNLTHLAPCFGASLKEVMIMDCKKLEELPEDLHCLNSLAKFCTDGCPALKSIPYNSSYKVHAFSQSFTSLRELRILRCDRLTELPIRMLEACTESLETVCLYNLKSLTNMAIGVGCLQKMPHLTTLELDFKNIPELANNNFPLDIGSFGSLRRLSITSSMENWDRVQDQLQHLTNLRSLRLIDLEVESLPEWLGKLSSLEELRLQNCRKLTCLPSKEAMIRLTKLLIHRCPRLNLKRDADDSEWHKISHITNITLPP